MERLSTKQNGETSTKGVVNRDAVHKWNEKDRDGVVGTCVEEREQIIVRWPGGTLELK